MTNTLYFSQCTLPLLDKAFDLRSALALPALQAWFERSQQVSLSKLDQSKLASPR